VKGLAKRIKGRGKMSLNKRLDTARKTRKNRRLTVEHLESRALLSAVPWYFQHFGGRSLTASFGSSSYGAQTATAVTAVDYSVSAPSQVQTGTSSAVKLTALGSNGRVAAGYSGTTAVANLTSSDSGATFFASSTSTTPVTSVTFTNGAATVYVKFANAGRQTITATDSTSSSIAGSASTLVTTPDVVTQYYMVLNPTVVGGSPTTVKILAEDAQGFVVRNYTTPSDFTLTSTDSKAVLPSNITFVNGVATVKVTFETGSATGTTESLTATDSANNLTTTATTSVVTDVASNYLIGLPSEVRAGQPVTVKVSAVDANGHTVTGYTGSATVAITGSSTTSQNVTFANGVATFSVTFDASAAGTQGTVTVTDQATTSPLPAAEAFTSVVTSSGRGGGWGWGWGWGDGDGSGGGDSSGSGGSSGSGTGSSGSSAPNASTSTNWSGYAVQSSAGSVSAVSGSWIVPTITSTGYSAVWVGIDGYQSSTVEQIGTEQDAGGTYYAWYEMYPGASQTITSLSISAGDSITASVVYSGGTFTLTLSDNTTGQSFSTQQSGANLQRSSAEWIVEAPSSGGVLPLANFGTVTFTNASATIDGTTGAINNSAWTPLAINMASNRGALEATTSVLNATGDGFSVTYDTSGGSSGFGGGGRFGRGGGWGRGGGFGGGFSTDQSLAASPQAARDWLFGSGFNFFGV
jgi:hypothetical protein